MQGEWWFEYIDDDGVAVPVARYRWWAPPGASRFEVVFVDCVICTTVGEVEDWDGFYVDEQGLVQYGLLVGVIPHEQSVTWYVVGTYPDGYQLTSETATFTAFIQEMATTTATSTTTTTTTTTTDN